MTLVSSCCVASFMNQMKHLLQLVNIYISFPKKRKGTWILPTLKSLLLYSRAAATHVVPARKYTRKKLAVAPKIFYCGLCHIHINWPRFDFFTWLSGIEVPLYCEVWLGDKVIHPIFFQTVHCHDRVPHFFEPPRAFLR